MNIYADNYTKPLPVGTKVRLIAPDGFLNFDEDYVGQVFEITNAEPEKEVYAPQQTHQINLKIEANGGDDWWVKDDQIEVIDYKEEK